MPYTLTRTGDGQHSIEPLSDLNALHLLRRGLRRGCAAASDKRHTVTITRTALRLAGEDVTEHQIVFTLTPTAPARRLTLTQYQDLERIRASGQRARLLPDGRIGASFCRIPPAAARRLLDRGLAVVVPTDGDRVKIGVAGLLAMAAFEHPVRTTTPRGWHYPDNGRIPTTRQHRRHPYQVPDYCSTAVCRCGFRAVADRRPFAAAFARNHLEQVLSAALQNP